MQQSILGITEEPRAPASRTVKLLPPMCLFSLSLIAYLRTMRPTFGWGDTSELITAAYYLGVGHSPGYPTWMLLAYPFAHLPIGEVAFRVNFMTALLGAIAIVLLYFLFHNITGNRIAAFVAALCFAFSATFWDITTEAEVYTLHICLSTGILLITLRWRNHTRKLNANRSDRWLYLISWLIGISLGNHALTALMIPALIYLAWAEQGWRFFTPKRVAACLGFLLLGLSVYAYLLIRAPANPPPHINNPQSLGELWKQMTAPGARQSMFSQEWSITLRSAVAFILGLRKEFSYAGCVLALIGLVSLWRHDRRLAIFLLLLAVVDIAYSCNFSIFDIYIYYLPLYLVWAAFIAVGASWALQIGSRLIERLQARGKTTARSSLNAAWRYGLVGALLLLLPFMQYTSHVRMVDGSNDFGSELFARAVFDQVEPGAMILADWWTIAPLGYLKYVEGERKDVIMYPAPSLSNEESFTRFAERDFLSRYQAIYYVEMLTYRVNLLRKRYLVVPEGPVSRIYLERPDPQTVLAKIPPTPLTRFGDQVALVRTEVEPGELQPGKCLDVTLYWAALPDYKRGKYETILFLENEKAKRIWQESNLLAHNLFPLDKWRPGEVLRERHRIYLSDPVPAGPYDLLVRVRPRGKSTCLPCDKALKGHHGRDYRIASITATEVKPPRMQDRIPAIIAWLRR